MKIIWNGHARFTHQAGESRVVIPMHFRSPGRGYDVIAPVEVFLALCDNVVRYEESALELTKDTPAQTALLKLPD